MGEPERRIFSQIVLGDDLGELSSPFPVFLSFVIIVFVALPQYFVAKLSFKYDAKLKINKGERKVKV